MQDHNLTDLPDVTESLEQSAFELAKCGKLEIVDLMSAAERLSLGANKAKAAELYRVWLENSTSPLRYVAHFNLGVILSASSLVKEAETEYRNALDLNPKLIQARLNLGNSLEQLKREDEALEQWRIVADSEGILQPENRPFLLHALNNQGRLLEIKKQYPAAIEVLERSFAVDSSQRDVIIHLVHLTQKICKWPIYNPPKGSTKIDMIRFTSPLAMLAFSDDPSLQLSAAKQFVEYKFPGCTSVQLAPEGGYKHEKIRIGYLSSDFCLHAVSLLTVELLELHNRDQFDLYGFCWSRKDGTEVQNRVIKALDRYIKIDGMDDKQAADCIRSHEIDIIVDLQGLTSGARPLILSYRPAVLQITYLGFPGATGLPWIDYVIADKYLIPDQLVPYHTEKPLYMPNCFQSSDRKRAVGQIPSRADNNLPENAMVFCVFNNNYKFTPEMFSTWMKILKRVPDSVLWLLEDNEWARENLIHTAKKYGIKRNRLIFASRVPPADYLARYQLADLFLDTFPFNGGTTANDALFMGLPLLTLSGRTFASRMAGSLLTYLGLSELITTNLKDYEEKAVRLAKRPKELAAIRNRLNESKETGPVFDIPGFVKGYEEALARALHNHTHSTSNKNSNRMAPVTEQVNDKPIYLYTIAYSAESKAGVEDGYLVLDNMQNERSDWREYWPIRRFLVNEELRPEAYYGFFSPKFSMKTGLTSAAVRAYMHDRAADVYIFSPQPDMGAFFLNVFEQNDVFDPGFKAISQETFSAIGLGVNLDNLIMDSRQIVFSNFIVAKREFWLAWLEVCEKIYAICEKGSDDLAKKLNEATTYQGVPRKVFLMERIASLLIKTGEWQTKSYDTFKCAWSGLGTNKFRDEAVISDALKLAYNELKYQEYLTGFSDIRKKMFFDRQ